MFWQEKNRWRLSLEVCRVKNNIINGNFETLGGIECHGYNGICTENFINKCQVAVHIAPRYSNVIESANINVSNNLMKDNAIGVEIWWNTDSTNTIGCSGLNICNNIIKISGYVLGQNFFRSTGLEPALFVGGILPASSDDNNNYKKAIRFGDETIKRSLQDCTEVINKKICLATYQNALQLMQTAATESDYKLAAELFKSIIYFYDSKEKERECLAKAEDVRSLTFYVKAKSICDTASTEFEFDEAANFSIIKDIRNKSKNNTVQINRFCKISAERSAFLFFKRSQTPWRDRWALLVQKAPRRQAREPLNTHCDHEFWKALKIALP